MARRPRKRREDHPRGRCGTCLRPMLRARRQGRLVEHMHLAPTERNRTMSAVLPKERVAELTDARIVPATTVVAAEAVTRRYGAGDTAVDALRGVSPEVPARALVAVMGA